MLAVIVPPHLKGERILQTWREFSTWDQELVATITAKRDCDTPLHGSLGISQLASKVSVFLLYAVCVLTLKSFIIIKWRQVRFMQDFSKSAYRFGCIGNANNKKNTGLPVGTTDVICIHVATAELHCQTFFFSSVGSSSFGRFEDSWIFFF